MFDLTPNICSILYDFKVLVELIFSVRINSYIYLLFVQVRLTVLVQTYTWDKKKLLFYNRIFLITGDQISRKYPTSKIWRKTNKINFKCKKATINEFLRLKYELSKHNGPICGKMATHQNINFA